ncbi:MAG: hypothetical protein AAGD07_09715 [Planctomycetota bacterium]
MRRSRESECGRLKPGLQRADRAIHLAGLLSCCVYAVISWLSWRFVPTTVPAERPLLLVLGLFALQFVIYAHICLRTLGWPRDRVEEGNASLQRPLKAIVLWAVVFRLVMLVSIPIQEVDLYRYLWDGAVAAQGISAFQHSPAEVIAVVDDASTSVENSWSTDLERLAELARSQPGLLDALRRVHYAHLPTVYPTTSQVVFASAFLTTPSDASLYLRTLILKSWLAGFDLATLLLILLCLRLAARPDSWCVLYAWCPLVLKEFANSGHLDAIAVMLTTLAIWLLGRAASQCGSKRSDRRRDVWLACVALAFAVGAKLYPIVLMPLFTGVLFRRWGWRTAAVGVTFVMVGSFALLSPMLPSSSRTPSVAVAREDDGFVDLNAPPQLVEEASPREIANDPSRGIKTFLKQWEMNDLLFMFVIENLRPASELGPKPWFVFIPDSIRSAITNGVADRFHVQASEAAFLTTRYLTAMLFAVIAVALAWRATNQVGLCYEGMQPWVGAAFLTIAWFWLLCPTQNPWYWTWALPMLPFVVNRSWFAISGLVFLYYTRFWFDAHYGDLPVWPTRYQGTAFFDFVMPWIEFGPILLLIAATAWRRRMRTKSSGECVVTDPLT